jgi:ubiquinone/menaquinone biosynthesis C-methylase UbiE
MSLPLGKYTENEGKGHMTTYDRIGTDYDDTRQADARITMALLAALDLPTASTLVDIGAGTGNYSLALAQAGFWVHAVEPSRTMRQQGKHHPRVMWHAALAEALPFADASVDGMLSTLAVHHFTDPKQSFSEMARVLREGGPVVLFVADPRLCPSDCWLADYFQPLFQRSYQTYFPLEELRHLLSEATGSLVESEPFLLPHDLVDSFFLSGWRSPEQYLRPSFRQSISPLAMAPAEVLKPCLQRLASELQNGAWHARYGHVLSQQTYDGGYRILKAHKQVK